MLACFSIENSYCRRIRFSPPKKLADSDGTPTSVECRTEMSTYSSLTEHKDMGV